MASKTVCIYYWTDQGIITTPTIHKKDGDDLATLADRLQLMVGQSDVAGHSVDADRLGAANRAWVAEHAMFGPAVKTFIERLKR